MDVSLQPGIIEVGEEKSTYCFMNPKLLLTYLVPTGMSKEAQLRRALLLTLARCGQAP